jgi:hypothetical protein
MPPALSWWIILCQIYTTTWVWIVDVDHAKPLLLMCEPFLFLNILVTFLLLIRNIILYVAGFITLLSIVFYIDMSL